MRYRDFAGKRASVIALGSVEFGTTRTEQTSFDFMDAFFEMGGNLIDTARVYGDFANDIPGASEETIGKWMAARKNREKIILSTKGGHPSLRDMRAGRLDRQSILSDMRDSLDALQTDYVDIYWLHRDDASRPVADIMDTLNELTGNGSARLIGASNWTAQRIEEANAYAHAHGMTGFSANQPQFSLARQVVIEDPTLEQMDAQMYAFHRRTGMVCMPFSSQAKGFYIKLAEGGEAALSKKARERFYYPENLEVYERLLALSAQTGYSVGTLSLAYLTSQPFDTFPIVGASRLSQIEALREAGDAVLTAGQIAHLRPFA